MRGATDAETAAAVHEPPTAEAPRRPRLGASPPTERGGAQAPAAGSLAAAPVAFAFVAVALAAATPRAGPLAAVLTATALAAAALVAALAADRIPLGLTLLGACKFCYEQLPELVRNWNRAADAVEFVWSQIRPAVERVGSAWRAGARWCNQTWSAPGRPPANVRAEHAATVEPAVADSGAAHKAGVEPAVKVVAVATDEASAETGAEAAAVKRAAVVSARRDGPPRGEGCAGLCVRDLCALAALGLAQVNAAYGCVLNHASAKLGAHYKGPRHVQGFSEPAVWSWGELHSGLGRVFPEEHYEGGLLRLLSCDLPCPDGA